VAKTSLGGRIPRGQGQKIRPQAVLENEDSISRSKIK